jgi:hypothetical protein
MIAHMFFSFGGDPTFVFTSLAFETRTIIYELVASAAVKIPFAVCNISGNG